MTEAKKGDRVRVNYVGTLDDGTKFDSSEGRDPLEFVIGEGKLLPAFEEAVGGLGAGDETTTVIEASDAYGLRNEELVFEVEKSFLPDGIDPEVGKSLQLKKDDGNVMPVQIAAIGEEKITIDANHPLAGQALTFKIKLIDIAESE